MNIVIGHDFKEYTTDLYVGALVKITHPLRLRLLEDTQRILLQNINPINFSKDSGILEMVHTTTPFRVLCFYETRSASYNIDPIYVVLYNSLHNQMAMCRITAKFNIITPLHKNQIYFAK